jgi:macrolide transport system ATP-binding/permease protein
MASGFAADPIHPSPFACINTIFGALQRDLIVACRALIRNPAFSTIVICSLALGIGANAAVFSLVDAIILRPLPVPQPNQIVTLDTAASQLSRFGSSSFLDYQELKQNSRSFEGLSLYRQTSVSMNLDAGVSASRPMVVSGLLVSGSYFSTLRVQPSAGRLFSVEADEALGKAPVVIISHALWQRAFHATPDAVGRQIRLNGHPFTVIGVAPRAFSGLELFRPPDVYIPLLMIAEVSQGGAELLKMRDDRVFHMFGRLRDGVAPATAQAEMNLLTADLERRYPATNKDTVTIVRQYLHRREEGAGVLFPAILATLVILVLAIACINVAGLLAARATARHGQISLQLALGASKTSLVRGFLMESAVLGTAAGMLALGLAFGAIHGFAALIPYSLTSSGPDFRLDARVVGFAALIAMLSTLFIGMAPAVLVKDKVLITALKSRTATGQGRLSGLTIRRVLVLGQVVLSVILLIGCGLFAKGFTRAQHVDLGFDPEGIVLMTVDTALVNYSDAKTQIFYKEMLRYAREMPRVKSASVSAVVPFIAASSWDLSIDGYLAPGGERFIDTMTNRIGTSYFETLRIPLLAGREFSEIDRAGSPLVAIVDETLARRFIVGNKDLNKALGHVIRLRDNVPISIVGVVKDSQYSVDGQLSDHSIPIFYLAISQELGPNMTFQIRTSSDLGSVSSALRQELTTLDPGLTPLSITQMSDVVAENALFMPRIAAIVGASFGVIAMILAVIGLYGLVAFTVQRRTQELAIRIAIGAQKSAILGLILRDILSLVALGLATGVLASALIAPRMSSLLYGVSPHDPGVIGLALLLILLTSMIAAWFPALKAARVDPASVFRYE